MHDARAQMTHHHQETNMWENFSLHLSEKRYILQSYDIILKVNILSCILGDSMHRCAK
jgi:hypothetical protein